MTRSVGLLQQPTPQSELPDASSNMEGRNHPELDRQLFILRAAKESRLQTNRPMQLQTRTQHNQPRTQMIAVHPHDVKGMAQVRKEMGENNARNQKKIQR